VNYLDDINPHINPVFGDLIKAAVKRAVMAAWEAGSITALEAWWIIQREGLQHK